MFVVFKAYPMQMCHFHQAKTARRYITKKLRLQAEKDLKKIIYRLKETNEKNFTKKLNEWEAVDKSILGYISLNTFIRFKNIFTLLKVSIKRDQPFFPFLF